MPRPTPSSKKVAAWKPRPHWLSCVRVCVLLLASVLCATAVSAQDKTLLRAELFPLSGEEAHRKNTRAEVLADRNVYWNDDGHGQFLALFLFPNTNTPSTHISLDLADAKAVLASQKVEVGTNTSSKARVLLHTDALKPGEYELRASLLAADGGVITNAVAAKFSRVNKSHPKVAIPKDGIPLIVHSQNHLGNASWPVTTGVPMPFGTLTDPSTLQVLEDGKPVPSQWTPRATWGPGEDASIQWLGLDFLARYEGGKPKQYRIVQAKSSPAAPVITAKQIDDLIEVDTGAIRFQVKRKGFNGIDSAWLGDRQVIAAPKPPAKDDKNAVRPPPFGPYLTDGREVLYEASDDDSAEVRIEEQGSVRVTILARGWYKNPEQSDVAGKELCQFVTRITAFAGEPIIRINHRTILAFDTRLNKLAHVSFAVPVTGSEHWSTSLDGVATNGALPKAGESIFLHQERADRVRLMANPKEKPLAEGKQADGWMAVASVNATVAGSIRDVWQRFPKELEADRDGLIFHFWPRHGRRVFTEEEELDKRNIYKVWFASQGRMLDLNMPREYYDKLEELDEKEGWDPEKTAEIGYMTTAEGVAIANEFELAFHAAAAKPEDLLARARLFQQNPHAIASPEWNVATLAEGHMAARDDKRWPEVERLLNDLYPNGMFNSGAFLGDYGMWIYGNTHNPWDGTQPRLHRIWQNSHYQHVAIPWFLYFRSGEPRLLDWARATTDNYMTVGTVNWHNPDRPIKGRTTGAMFHAKGFMPWGSRHYGMYQFDGDVSIWGHWVNPDAFRIRWLIEGDLRARDLYQTWGNALFQGRSSLGAGREASNTLGETLAYYTTTWDPQTIVYVRDLTAGMTSVPFEKFPHPPSFPFWHRQWIDRYHDLTRDDRVVPAVESYIKAGFGGGGSVQSFAYRTTGKKEYLDHAMAGAYDAARMAYDNPGDPLHGFGPHAMATGVIVMRELPYVLGAMREAGIPQLVTTPADKSYYPVGASHLYAQTGRREISLTVLVLDSDDREFKVTIGPIDPGMHPADALIASPSGKVLHVLQKLRESGKSVEVVTIPKDGEKGIYLIELFGHLPQFQAPFTNLPYEIAQLPKEQGVRALQRQMGYIALPPNSKVQMKFTALSYGQIPAPNYAFVADPTGKTLLETTLMQIGQRKEATVELQSADKSVAFPYYTVSWAGPSMTWSGDAEAVYVARDPKALDAILKVLATAPKQEPQK